MADQMPLGPIGNIFYFVERFDEAVKWYSDRLGREPVIAGGALAAFDIDGTRLTIHKIDELNDKGPSGVAAYWTVPDVDQVVAEWTKHGAVAHRGPKTVFTHERLCQLLDPFGNLFGVRQPAPYAGEPPEPVT
ncbi:VOC family protein [Phenylobacterium sp.]|uniref:VOC family protein n=1 Tax=Phenylobacterium sp. TaxID=1871053 RepID=UPI0012070C75|nr:VOC family protein [Phenylobacterium sp.]THD61528.1 MAG: hypothetical protein E8A49_11140 [Phenylobacterium sp.]